jgi:hypothetical protein
MLLPPADWAGLSDDLHAETHATASKAKVQDVLPIIWVLLKVALF